MRQQFPQMFKSRALAFAMAVLLFATPLSSFAQSDMPFGVDYAVSTATTSIVSCSKFGDKISTFFGGPATGGIIAQESAEKIQKEADEARRKLEAETEIATQKALGDGLAVPVTDDEIAAELSAIRKLQEERLKEIAEEAKKQTRKEQCLDALANNVAKNMLKDIGDRTERWINSGFEGNSLYVEDYGTYFSWWYDTQREAFYEDLLSSNNPFASATVTILNSEQTKGFNINFNLDKYNNDWEGFYRGDNFNWESYTAMGELANNPIGTLLASSDELDRQLRDRQTQIQMDMQGNGGFISYQTCVDVDGNQAVYPATKVDPATGQTVVHPKAGQDMSIFDPACQYRKINTPASIVADQITEDLGTSRRQLELADELNEVLAQIFDALLTKAMHEGLDALDS